MLLPCQVYDCDYCQNWKQQGYYSKLLKSLDLSEKDSVEIRECNGGLVLQKADCRADVTPFTALDDWNSQHGFDGNFSLEEVNDYVKSIRGGRTNKEIVEDWLS